MAISLPQGDADSKVPAFSWRDLQRGAGPFNEKDARWQQLSQVITDKAVVSVFSHALENKSGLCEYLLRGRIAVPRDVLFALHVDAEYRSTWDGTCVSVTELEGVDATHSITEASQTHSHGQLLHWEANYPWPWGRRDYVFLQNVHTEQGDAGDELVCVHGHTVPVMASSQIQPCAKNLLRIDDYSARLVIWSAPSRDEACFALFYMEDPKTSIPSWVLPQVAASTIPTHMNGLMSVAASYPRMRLEQILRRHGRTLRADVASTAARGAEGDLTDAEEEAFFSASDEDTPPQAVPAKTSSMAVGRAAGLDAPAPSSIPSLSSAAKARSAGGREKQRCRLGRPFVATRFKDNDAILHSKSLLSEFELADLEEGYLRLDKDEKALLLDIIADKRLKQVSSWWCCACRRRSCFRKSNKS